jgi:hypothetical protein
MADKKYQSYSSKGLSVLGTGVGYGVNEMAETATSMGLSNQRRVLIEGISSGVENQFLNDVIQDGVGAGLGFLTGQVMRVQEYALSSAYKTGAVAVTAWYGKSKLKGFLKGKKGRKLGMISKFIGDTDKKAEECRLISDFTAMNIQATSNSNNPQAKHNMLEGRFKHDSLEVKKEGVRSSLAKLQVDGLRDTFEMKLKTSSFFSTDKKLIKQMTGMTSVTDKEIKKLNALSSAMVSLDNEGNWIGGNEASINLLNALGLHRAN